MKGLLVALGCSCGTAWAQEKLPPRSEGASVIAVLLPDSGNVAFERVARLLVQQGYQLETRNPTTQCLTTEPRPLPEAHFSTSVQVIVMGHTALFSGSAFYQYKTLDYRRPLYYSAHNKVAFANYDYIGAGWQELEALVRALLGKRKVVYFEH